MPCPQAVTTTPKPEVADVVMGLRAALGALSMSDVAAATGIITGLLRALVKRGADYEPM